MDIDYHPPGGLPELVNGFVFLVVLLLTLFGLFWLVSRVMGGGYRLMTARPPPVDSLDTVLFAWTPDDALTIRDMLSGGFLVLGRPGSGKSSSSSFQLLKAAVGYKRSGGLILAASPGDRELCQRVFAGQPDRLVIFDERTDYRFNAIDFILQCGGSTKDILAAIMAIAETVDRGGGQVGGDDSSFFSIGARRVIEHAVVVVKHATGEISPTDLMAFINSAASSLIEVHSEDFKATLHYQFLKTAHDKEKAKTEEYDYDNAREFFTVELPKMADKTRTSLLAVVMNTLHIFNSGVNRLLFATDTTITPRLVDKGKWIFVDMPVSRCGQEGAFALGVFKFLTEWYVMRRDSSLDNPPCIIHVDELHRTINSYDSLFLGECRKFGGCMIACSQSKASFYANMGGSASEAQVDALLNNFSHKIIHALGDVKSAEWASQLCGSAMQFNVGGSEQRPDSMLDAWKGKGVWSGSLSSQVRPMVEARHFMHGFRTGGRNNDYLCDAVVIRSGEPFANGENFLMGAFQSEMRMPCPGPTPGNPTGRGPISSA